MTGTLLLRGMIVGFIAALLSLSACSRLSASRRSTARSRSNRRWTRRKPRPSMTRRSPGAKRPQPTRKSPNSSAVPSRRGIGLLTGVAVYGAAIGGLFALGLRALLRPHGRFQSAYDGRAGWRFRASSRSISSQSSSIRRTRPRSAIPTRSACARRSISSMILLSLAAMIAAWTVRKRLLPQFGAWNATLIAAATYLVAVVIVGFAMPPLNEVPDGFPAIVAVAVPHGVAWRAGDPVGDARARASAPGSNAIWRQRAGRPGCGRPDPCTAAGAT